MCYQCQYEKNLLSSKEVKAYKIQLEFWKDQSSFLDYVDFYGEI